MELVFAFLGSRFSIPSVVKFTMADQDVPASGRPTRTCRDITDEMMQENDPDKLHKLTEELFQAMVDNEREKIIKRFRREPHTC